MRRARSAQAGVTLIEMLVALSISALIGLAGFIFLESVTRTEAGVAGRLDRINAQDRAFRLLTRDMDKARAAVFETELELRVAEQIIIWRATETGLVRRIDFADRPEIEQSILDEPATLTSRSPDTVTLTLPGSDVWRLVLLPREPVQ
ncbi:MAG: prepilin-type N-terminal cleavage/methylation domain-containing protein [Pseudomonadota bacterium]